MPIGSVVVDEPAMPMLATIGGVSPYAACGKRLVRRAVVAIADRTLPIPDVAM